MYLQAIQWSHNEFVWHFRELNWKEIAFQDAFLEHCKRALYEWIYRPSMAQHDACMAYIIVHSNQYIHIIVLLLYIAT